MILLSAVGWWFVLAVVGCDLTASNSTGVNQESLPGADQPSAHQPFTDKHVSIDAGILVPGRDGYLCLPLERVGLITDNDVVSVETSCSCVKARPVTYISADESLEQAILLEYVDKPSASAPASAVSEAVPIAVQLSVEVAIHLGGGDTHLFSVNLLHTVLT